MSVPRSPRDRGALGLTCAYGTDWQTHDDGCLFCAAAGDALAEAFRADVAKGIYDREEYTPADRKRATARGRGRA